MCTVSIISDYGRQTFPNLEWWQTQQQSLPQRDRTEEVLAELRAQRAILEKFVEMVAKAKEFDVVAKQPDCEDPAKASFMDEVQSRLRRIEEALGFQQ